MNESHDSAAQSPEIKVLGVPAELEGGVREFIESLLEMVRRTMDLTGLDGVTFAGDYHQALMDLDKGYDADYQSSPSNDHGVGIAMSPRVVRDGVLKTHIVLSAQAFFAMLNDKRSDMVVNTVAHECAHVELYRLFEVAFPGNLLGKKTNALDSFRNDCMLACWNEFGACWRSALLGPSDKLAYEGVFLPALEETRPAANSAITEYLDNGDIRVVVNEVCGLYGNLLKYSAYHLGNLHGLGIDWRTVPTTADTLQDHWFLPFFERLDRSCKAIAADLGSWTNSASFDELEDIAEDLVADGGMHFVRHEDDRISLHIA